MRRYYTPDPLIFDPGEPPPCTEHNEREADAIRYELDRDLDLVRRAAQRLTDAPAVYETQDMEAMPW